LAVQCCLSLYLPKAPTICCAGWVDGAAPPAGRVAAERYRTLFRGTGMDLADLREYRVPRRVRHIDWNVTAQLQQPRACSPNREMSAWFCWTLSPSMDFWLGRQRQAPGADRLCGGCWLLTPRRKAASTPCSDCHGVDAVLPRRAANEHVL
jgi:hypothetical protein